jgi:hypothetical protein
MGRCGIAPRFTERFERCASIGNSSQSFSVKSVIVGLRARQNIKQKQQPKHPEEYEANVC